MLSLCRVFAILLLLKLILLNGWCLEVDVLLFIFPHSSTKTINFRPSFFAPQHEIITNCIIILYYIWNIANRNNYYDKFVPFYVQTFLQIYTLPYKKTRMNASKSIIQIYRWWFPRSWQFQMSNNIFVLHLWKFFWSVR